MSRRVSAIIPTYNYRHFVVAAVESALAQTYRPLEVIVIDDGSTDGTEEELRPFEDRVRYLRQENRGLSAARNTGIRAASGELVALLDADDLWAPTKTEKQVAVMEASPEVGLVSCDMHRVDVRTGARELYRHPSDLRGDIRRKLLHHNRVTPSTALVRRACFDAVGLFDEALRSVEDWDMWIRISRRFHFDYVAEPLATIRRHGENMSAKIETMHQHRVQVLRRAFRDDPIDGANRLLLRRNLSDLHVRAGRRYYHDGAYRPAVRHLIQAVALWPFSYEHNLLLLRAMRKRVVVREQGSTTRRRGAEKSPAAAPAARERPR